MRLLKQLAGNCSLNNAHAWLFAVDHMQDTSWMWTQSLFLQRTWVKMQLPAKVNSMLPSCPASLLHLSQQDRRLQSGGADDTTGMPYSWSVGAVAASLLITGIALFS